jgi:methylaspartate ammonia-lyase
MVKCKGVISIEPDATLEQAAQITVKNKIGCLPMLEDNFVVGIITDLQADSIPLAERYTAPVVTIGFHAVCEVTEAVSVGLMLDNGGVAWGDCVAVAYSGKTGRAPVFRAEEWANNLEDIQAFIDAQAADVIQVKMPDLGSVHNSVEAVLACRAGGVGTFLGGSCAETDLSARVAVHVALTTRPDVVMAKPGMGVDEAVTLVQNEMARTLAWVRAREPGYE